MRESIEDYLYDPDGNLLELEVGPFFLEGKRFEPLVPQYPNISKYLIVSKTAGKIIIEDSDMAEAVIGELKKRYRMTDPWDDDPNYFSRE